MPAPRLTVLIVALGLLPTLALAHSGPHPPGFLAGLMHPMTGPDHLLAMLAVGAWTAMTRISRGGWVPVAFAGGMLAGALLGVSGHGLPSVEALIALSLLIFGGLLMTGRTLSRTAACVLAGGLAMFHGHAHGTEVPATAATAAWLLGMVAASLLLPLAGASLSRASRHHPVRLRAAGAVVAIAGSSLLLGL